MQTATQATEVTRFRKACQDWSNGIFQPRWVNSMIAPSYMVRLRQLREWREKLIYQGHNDLPEV